MVLLTIKFIMHSLHRVHKMDTQLGGCVHPTACFISKITEWI